MPKPGDGQEHNMGPNIASVQSLLDSTRDRSSGGHEEDDKSALAIMSAVMATPSEALKSDVVGSLVGNVDKSVMSLGANLTTQFSIFSPTKGVSLAFGFPILFDSMEGGGGDVGGESHGGGYEDMGAEGEMHADDSQHSPWDFDQYPHADESIGEAARGLEGVSHSGEERDHHHDISPSPSPVVSQASHDHGEGMHH